ncbi:uncharacterized protein LOC144162321 [Haemaphysalis longicornis]
MSTAEPPECIRDDASSSSELEVLRANLQDEGSACHWVEEYGLRTNTSWIVESVQSTARCQKMVLHKTWRCKQNARKKPSGSSGASCPAKIDIKIKKTNRHTKKNDPFLRRPSPLPAVIRLWHQEGHSHSTTSADALRRLGPATTTKEAFVGYFNDAMSPAEAIRLHESKLLVQEGGFTLLANAALNPLPAAVYYWHRLWRQENFGKQVDPLDKLAEKMPTYEEQGIDVRLNRTKDGASWAVLVATPIMRRAQQLHTARELIFVDSTSSCDATHATVTVLLAATSAGAVPIAVLLHNAQTAEAYATAFTLLKEAYPLCFGGLSAPGAFMTDNSAAEKAALRTTWPEGRQLLCHFHVAQAEWRWLTAARNNVEKDQRRALMTKFQQIMYATSVEGLNKAIEGLRGSSHEGYKARVEAFLQQQQGEWLLLCRADLTTRGHNTNNFAEASIRILKDIVLSRTKAFNAVALVESVGQVMEEYFKSRILKHANNRVSTHHLLYHSLLKRMPEEAAADIRVLGDGCFSVPSSSGNGEWYEVWGHTGLCTCPAGNSGAFCKHQALVHKHYGGLFPNCPALTAEDRHELGWLALGSECPSIDYFTASGDEVTPSQRASLPRCQNGEPVACSSQDFPPEPAASPCQEEQPEQDALCDALPSTSGSQQQDRKDADDNLEALIAEMRKIHEAEWHKDSYRKHLTSASMRLQRLCKQQRGVGAIMAMNSALGLELRRGRTIKVQPTALSRRRPGLTKGSKRVPAGRPPNNAALKAARKRPHVLCRSVGANVPHAKMHGQGH